MPAFICSFFFPFFVTLLATLTTASSTTQGYCPGPILSNNICCASGYEIDPTTGTARCNAYGTTTFQAVLATPTSPAILAHIPSTSATAVTDGAEKDERAIDGSAATPSTNDGPLAAMLASPTPSVAITDAKGRGLQAAPAPTPTVLTARQYNTVTFPNGNGGYGTVAYPNAGTIGDPYYGGGYGTYGPDGLSYSNPYVAVSGAGADPYYNGYEGGRYPVGYTARATYVTQGPSGPVTVTQTYRAGAEGRKGVRFVGAGMGMLGLFGLGLV